MDTPPEFSIAIGRHGSTRAVRDGAVTHPAFSLRFVDVETLPQAFRRMVRGNEFDIAEMAVTTYVVARAHGKPFTALPIFPVRAFHHGAILASNRAGVIEPHDLTGRKVGLNRGYTVTTGVWARSILADEYGVDLDSITWLVAGDEHVLEFRAPGNVQPLPTGSTLSALLSAGGLAAGIGIDGDPAETRPLIADALDAGLAAFEARGHYPINHLLVLRDEVLAAYPALAVQLCELFRAARDAYVAGLLDEQPGAERTRADDVYRRVLARTGQPLPYGIAPNRAVLEQLLRAASAQHIVDSPGTVDSLFVPATRTLAL